MKKIISVSLVFMLVFGVIGCEANQKNNNTKVVNDCAEKDIYNFDVEVKDVVKEKTLGYIIYKATILNGDYKGKTFAIEPSYNKGLDKNGDTIKKGDQLSIDRGRLSKSKEKNLQIITVSSNTCIEINKHNDNNYTEEINIFESQVNWENYMNGQYTGKNVSFSGTVMADAVGSGALDGSGVDVFNVYMIQYKVDNGYYVCTIGTTGDKKLSKGQQVNGWGIINQNKNYLGAPLIVVLSIN